MSGFDRRFGHVLMRKEMEVERLTKELYAERKS